MSSQLADALDRLMRGDIGLHDLDPALAAWFHYGHVVGRESRAAELDALRAELDRERLAADRYYTAAYDPDGHAIVKRMDEHAESAALHETHSRQYADALRVACDSPRGHAA